MPRRSRSGSRSKKKSSHDHSPTKSLPNRTLFIRNLSYSTSRTDVQQLFERFGPVQDIYLPLDYFTGEPRGFGYVTFFSLSDARNAKSRADGIPLSGKCMHVMYAATEPLHAWEMREKYRRPGSSHERNRNPGHTVEFRNMSPPRRIRRRSQSPYRLLPYDNEPFHNPPVYLNHRKRRSRSRSPQPKYRRKCRSPTPRSIPKKPLERKKESKRSNSSKLAKREPMKSADELKKKKLSEQNRRPRSPKATPSLPPKSSAVEEFNAIKRDYSETTSDSSNNPDQYKPAYMPIAAPKSVHSKEFGKLQ